MGSETIKTVKTVLTAEDRTAAAYKSLEANMLRIESAQGRLNAAAAVFAAGGLAVGFLAIAKNALDVAEAIGRAADRSQMGVEKFSALAYAAKQSDVGLEGLETSVKKLALAQERAAAGDTKYLNLWKALGVNVRDTNGTLKTSERLLYDVADAFASAKDGPGKIAVGTELLGRQFTEVLPLLNRGANEIKRLEAEARALGKTVDEETARAADKFNKDLDTLKDNSAALARNLTQNVVPALSDVAKAMIQARNDTGLLMSLWVGLGGLGNIVFGNGLDTELDKLDKLGNRIEELGNRIEHMRKAGYQSEFLKPEIEELKTLLALGAKLEGQMRAAERIRENAGGRYNDPRDYRVALAKSPQRELSLPSESISAYERELAAANQALAIAQAEAANGSDKLTASERKLLEVMQSQDWAKFTKTQQGTIKTILDRAAGIERNTVATEQLFQAQQKLLELDEQAQREIDDLLKIGDERVRGLQDEIDRYQVETSAMGKANEERELELSQYARRIALRGPLTEAQQQAINLKYDEIDALIKARNAQQNELALWTDIADRGVDFLQRLRSNGKSTFQALIDYARDFGRELLALFAKKMILQIGASVTGSAALASQAASSGAGSLAGAILGGSSGGILGSLGLFSQGLSGAIPAAAIGSEAIAAGVGIESAAAGLGSSIASAIGAIPVWGQIALAIGALAAILSRNRGGAKEEGSFFGIYDAQGRLAQNATQSAANPFGIANPTQAGNETASALGQKIAEGYFQALRALGGSTTGINFGASIVRDPRGTSPTFLDAFAQTAAGRTLLHLHNDQVARTPEAEQAEAALQAQRVILAALQASELPEDIARIINSLDAATATAEQIAAVTNLAQAFKGLHATIASLEGGPLDALKKSLDDMASKIAAASSAFDQALSSGDYAQIASSEQELQAAILSRYQTEIANVRQLEASIRQIQQESYEFALSIAQRIAQLGGSRNIGALALGRASAIRGQAGSGPLDLQLQGVRNYVGAIDAWYQARRQEIEANMAAEREAAQAIAQAQASAAQARINALQNELAMVQQFQAIVDRARGMLDEMRLTSLNPLGVLGRLDLAKGDVARLQAAYEAATGSSKADAANRLLDAIKAAQGLGTEAFQRSSPEWQSLYNELASLTTKVQEDAQGMADRAVDLQQQLLDAQAQANSYANVTAAATSSSSGALDALNQEALGYYTWAEAEGERVFREQERQHQEQLTLITGGQTTDLFIAQRSADTVALLQSIDARIAAFLERTTGAAAGAGEGSSGNPEGNVTINVNINGSGVTTADVIAAIDVAAPYIKRKLALA